jgi:hypothetical protein
MIDERHPTTRHEDPAISPLIGAVPVEGPPILLLALPWLFIVLLLAGPFALLATIVFAMLAVALVVCALAAIVASPYLLVRHLRVARTRREASRAVVEPALANPPAMAGRALPPKVSAPGC